MFFGGVMRCLLVIVRCVIDWFVSDSDILMG